MMKRGKSKSPATKLILCVLFISFVLSAPPLWAGEIIIGTGTSDWYFPLATYYYDARTQTIYLAGEIGGSCNIIALALDVTEVPSQPMNNFTIRMRHTGLGVYPGSPSWESSDWITVYQTNQTITTTGWVEFDFTTPFEYDGSQNLIVDISFYNSPYSSAGYCRYSTPGGNRTIYYGTYGDYGDPLTWSGTTPTPYVTTSVPNIKLIVNQVARPVFTPDGGTYNSEQNVVISCPTDGATIHYTINGNDPTESDPVIASGSSVLIDHALTLKAKAWKDGLDPSNIRSADYQLKVATPVFAPDGGYHSSEQDVVITCSTAGATIHYTTNGNDPTESDPTIASGGSVLVSVDPPTTILKAKAWKTGFEPSSIKETTYLYPVLTSITPSAAKQGQSLTVTITGFNTRFGQGSGTGLFEPCTPTQGSPTVTDVWLSHGSSTIDWVSGWGLYNTLFYALFYIPDDANPGKWDLHVEITQCTPTTTWDLTLSDGFMIAQPGDITCDGAVNFFDVAALGNHWLEGTGE
jgi:hypothetical protein